MIHIHAQTALLPTGWAQDVRIAISADGRIAPPDGNAPADHRVDMLLPAPANLHSHAFQRAMSGLTEARSTGTSDSFWTWRQLMYRFLDHLTPDDVEAIAAYAQMEMLEAGFAAVGEFHYLHHRPGGKPYDRIGEMADRIAAAARETGIGLTLLPVLYMQGGADGRALNGGQLRFGCDLERFDRLMSDCADILRDLPTDAVLGVAPHSLRAVLPDGLEQCASYAGPIHMHLAEQKAEVIEVRSTFGARPAEWLCDTQDVNDRWCLIHCTQMTPTETATLARTGAVAGLCPITESNLGDGIFDAPGWTKAGGRLGVGSDSNLRISLTEELRTLEHSQRLRDHARAVLADDARSTGHALLAQVVKGGAQALGRHSGAIAPGHWADLVALDLSGPDCAGRTDDQMLDTWIFGQGGPTVHHLWTAGRHMVQDGRHIHRARLAARYAACLGSLMERVA